MVDAAGGAFPRPDLLSLSDDSLAALANRGIVKRSLREVAEGKGPAVDVTADGTVTGTFADGSTVILPPGTSLEDAACTCPASTVCRHRVMVVIAIRGHASPAAGGAVGHAMTSGDVGPAGSGEPARQGPEAVAAPEPWSPGEFSDDDLEALLGTRVMGQARKAFRSGYRARIRRASAADPVPAVELPSCTVRFLVPHELGYARVDAARGTRDDAIALAVWACRAADTAGGDGPVVELAVGGEGAGGVARAGDGHGVGDGASGVEPVLDLVADLLADGVVHSGGAMAGAFTRARRALDRRNLRWPVDVLDELAVQLEAYRARSARHRAGEVAALLAEIVARHRCVAGGGAALRPGVLGTEEAAETPLRLLRLTGLGARVAGDDRCRTVEVYLAHPEAGIVLALRRRVEVDPDADADAEPPSAEVLGRRKAGGARLSALAAGNVVTESAVRSANRVVRIAESRVARTTVTPSAGAWHELPAGILVGDLDEEAARLAGLPPAMVRPRVAAEAVRAVVVEAVEDVVYQPGEQRLVAEIRAPSGRARISLAHTAAAAGAVDALAEALRGAHGPVDFVAGHLRRHGGEVVIEPTAVVAGATIVVPGFAPANAAALSPGVAGGDEPLAAVLDEALAVSAGVLHRGWRHLPPGWSGRAERCARQLRRVGLERAAAGMDDLATVARAGLDDGALLDRWADTHIRLSVTAEQL